MSGVLHGIVASLKAAAAAATDSFFKYVTLLLHGDGTNGAQNNTFLDGSTNAFTITRNGNTTQGSFSPFSQTGWSNFFDGNGDYLAVPNNTDTDISTGDFTIECWMNFTAFVNDTKVYIDITSASFYWQWNYNTTTGMGLVLGGGGFSFNQGSTAGWNVGAWYHVALVRNGSNFTIYRDGVSIATGTSASSIGSYTNKQIGGWSGDANTSHRGYISNFRIVKGTAVYTANFTPPTAPLTAITNTKILTCQSNRFIDNSSNAFAITRNGDVRVEAFSPFNPSTTYSTANVGGSGYFDGTGDYLNIAANTALDVGSGDFTIEFFAYPFSKTNGVDSAFGYGPFTMMVYHDNTNWTLEMSNNGTSNQISVTFAINLTSWQHVAIVKSGTSVTVYRNGVSVATGTISGSVNTASKNLDVGRNNVTTATQSFTGYLSNFRLVKGTAVYTAAFTPPTAPLTAIANTSLLLNFTNGGIFDNASQTVLETVGNAQVSTAQFKYGTGSMYFDGTGDWLTAIDRPALRFGTAAFTIECWLYLGATGAARGIVGKGTATTGWLLSTDASNKVVFTYGSSTITSTAALSGSTWYFLTVVREGTGTNQTKIYIDGTNDGTGTVSTDFNQTSIMYVGADRTGGSAMNGYIDDLRITNGYARYTANFTPPTAAFPDN